MRAIFNFDGLDGVFYIGLFALCVVVLCLSVWKLFTALEVIVGMPSFGFGVSDVTLTVVLQ